MSSPVRVLCVLLIAAHLPIRAQAQQPARNGRLIVTVVDPANGVIPTATVTVVGLEPATQARTVAPVRTTERGVATIDGLVVGRYSIKAEFAGFDIGLVRDIRVNAGDNRRVVVLPLLKVEDTVTVGDRQDALAGRSAGSFGQTLSQAEIATLSDDPAELARQIAELAGPDAIVRVDSFEGAQLPPKSQIKSVHVTRDQFAAEAEQPGSTFVDIITQPGVGALAGGFNAAVRENRLAGRSQFVSARGPDANRTYGANLSGTLIKDRSNFSISMNGQNQYSSPILNQAGSTAQVLDLRQPNKYLSMNGLFDYALTRDQTLRFSAALYRQRAENQGVGQFDSLERASSNFYNAYQFRIQEAGPIGRRIFINTRLFFTGWETGARANVEAPTIVIQDGKTTGGAQVDGSTRVKFFNFASDLDYIRGIHSWRVGLLSYGGWFHSDRRSNYLGTYTFANQAAFDAGTPLLYTQTIGNPVVAYFDARTAAYFQDDIRLRRSLTLSPGVRFSHQTGINDWSSFSPRFGLTWSPFAGGRTAVRFSAGLFTYFRDPGIVLEQSLRLDGQHQREVIVVNPAYPDPGPTVAQPPNKYVQGDFKLQRNLRYSFGIDQTISPRVRVNALYNYVHQFKFWSADNVNAPINGVRPDPAFANIIVARTNGETRRHELTANLNVTLAAPSPALNQAWFNWRRAQFALSFGTLHARNNSEGPWNPSPTGTLDTEWGPSVETVGADRPFRFTLSLTSTQVKNLTAALTFLGLSGYPYTITTGIDDNGDGLLNDRPAGVGRRTLRMPSQYTPSLRLAYTITTGTPSTARRYRLGITLNATNVTNHPNYAGHSGNLRSSFFMRPSMVANPRRVDLGFNVGF